MILRLSVSSQPRRSFEHQYSPDRLSSDLAANDTPPLALRFTTCSHTKLFFFLSFFTFHFDPVIHRCHSRSTYFSKQLLPILMLQPDTYYGAGPFRHKRLRDKTKRRRTKNRNSRAQRQLTPWGCFCPALPCPGSAPLSPFPFSIPLAFQSLRSGTP